MRQIGGHELLRLKSARRVDCASMLDSLQAAYDDIVYPDMPCCMCMLMCTSRQGSRCTSCFTLHGADACTKALYLHVSASG